MNLERGNFGRPGVDGSLTRQFADSWQPRAFALRVRAFCTLVMLDGLCITGSFLLAAFLRGTFSTDTNWPVILVVLLPVFVVTALNIHAYSATNLQDPFRAIAKGLQAMILAVCAVIFVAFCLKTSGSFPRLVVTVGTSFSILSLAAARYLFVRHIDRIVGGNPFNVVLLCDGNQPVPPGKFSIIVASDAYFDPERHDPVMYDRLAQALESADRVIVACSPDRRNVWANALKGANIQSEIFIPELDALAPLGMGNHDGMPTVIIANGPLGLIDRFIKRSFDVVCASLALILLAPLFAVVAILIKWDSRGSVLFTQTRIGRGNQMFQMIKFRSMQVDGCDGAGDRSTAREDDRITRIGRFIRKTSIDELPQLVNVVRGDMSIVGPRPHALGSRAADKLFWEVDQRYWHRHATKPGLTGLAQIRGYRGATLQEDDLRNRLQADLEYLDTWSIWRDLKIIALTFRVLLHRNAF